MEVPIMGLGSYLSRQVLAEQVWEYGIRPLAPMSNPGMVAYVVTTTVVGVQQ